MPSITVLPTVRSRSVEGPSFITAAVWCAGMPKLLRYVAGTCATLALLEGAFRIFGREIAAAETRAGTKAALLDRHGPVEVLFFGTSRLWDAVSPRAFSAVFPGARAFSLAASGAKLETLERLGSRFARRPGLRLAFVELSGPQLEPEPPQASPPAGVEAFAARHLALVEHRAALRGESLERLQELFVFPARLDGSELHPRDFVDAWFGHPPRRAPEDDLRPVLVTPAAAAIPPAAARMLAVASALRQGGARVVFVIPPVRPCEPPEDLSAAPALAVEFPVWSYQHVPLPPDRFRDCSHLNGEGRAAFSRALAQEALRAGIGPTFARRAD